ncbi:predicted protein [Mycobacterium tuberculosis T17]|nr:predicted protein [Mycobacterium tuberculosis T17]
MAADTSSPAAANSPLVGTAAAALAAVRDAPMPARSSVAIATKSGAAITKDIRHLAAGRCDLTVAHRYDTRI